jgi:hypothetical protein
MKRLALVLALAPSAVAADEVYLRGGGQLSGVVLERTAASVLIEVGPGQIRLPMSRVLRIATGPSALAHYRTRAAALAGADVNGWLQLARWAEAQGLLTQAREAYEHVIDVDPSNAPAHQALGDVLLGERWVSEEESYRARGFVLFEGAWMRTEEQRARLAERTAEIEQQRAWVEAEARTREAEARARAAEAEARRAEAALEAESEPAGIPYGMYGPAVYGPAFYGPGLGASACGGCRRPVEAGIVVVQPVMRPFHGHTHHPSGSGSAAAAGTSRMQPERPVSH